MVEDTPQVRVYQFDRASSRYRDTATGRYVPFRQVRDALDTVLDSSATEMQKLARQLQDGVIGLSQWQTDMAGLVKSVHLISLAASKGGWQQLTQSDYGKAGQVIREQYRYLANFAAELASGAQPLDGRFLIRAGMYAQAARTTYEDVRQGTMRELGYSLERRILGVADHCEGCLSAASQGWQPIGTLPQIGEVECRVNCHCHFDYREVKVKEEALK